MLCSFLNQNLRSLKKAEFHPAFSSQFSPWANSVTTNDDKYVGFDQGSEIRRRSKWFLALRKRFWKPVCPFFGGGKPGYLHTNLRFFRRNVEHFEIFLLGRFLMEHSLGFQKIPCGLSKNVYTGQSLGNLVLKKHHCQSYTTAIIIRSAFTAWTVP